MSRHIMLDIETMGHTRDSVILTFGAVCFDPYSSEEPYSPLYHRLNVDQQFELGRVTTESTLEWWGKQPPEIFEEAMGEDGRTDLEVFVKDLNKYLVGADKIWAQGPLFDIILIEDLYRMLGIPTPWQYWQIRDSRTLFDLGSADAKLNNKSAHNALADAYAQAISVQNVLYNLGVKKPVK